MTNDELKGTLARWLDEGRGVIGEVKIVKEGQGFVLRHLDDTEETVEEYFGNAVDAREIARYDASGEFRPIKTAPTLIRGWQMDLRSLGELQLALEFFYPAALGMAMAQEKGTLEPVPLRSLLGRQTGMYRFANGITDAQANEIIGACCDTPTKCLRRIVYPLDSTQPLSGPAAAKLSDEAGHAPGQTQAIPLFCMESCNHIVSAARSVSRQNADKKKQETAG